MDHLKSFYSIVHGSDVVARIPRVGYRPSSGKNLKQLWFSNAGEDYINPPKDLKVADWSVKDSVEDHMMTGYCQRIAAFCSDCLKTTLAAHDVEMQTASNRRKRKKRKK